MFTYNQSTNYIEIVENNTENIVLICEAQGGRPEPTFTWFIEDNLVT